MWIVCISQYSLCDCSRFCIKRSSINSGFHGDLDIQLRLRLIHNQFEVEIFLLEVWGQQSFLCQYIAIVFFLPFNCLQIKVHCHNNRILLKNLPILWGEDYISLRLDLAFVFRNVKSNGVVALNFLQDLCLLFGSIVEESKGEAIGCLWDVADFDLVFSVDAEGLFGWDAVGLSFFCDEFDVGVIDGELWCLELLEIPIKLNVFLSTLCFVAILIIFSVLRCATAHISWNQFAL
jgi:hypothetical protein